MRISSFTPTALSVALALALGSAIADDKSGTSGQSNTGRPTAGQTDPSTTGAPGTSGAQAGTNQSGSQSGATTGNRNQAGNTGNTAPNTAPNTGTAGATGQDSVTANPQANVEDVQGRGNSMPPEASATSAPDWTQIQPSSKLSKMEVRAKNGRKLGTIKDTIIDPSTGRVMYGVVAMGNKNHPVPWSSLRWERDHYVLDMDQERLSAAPGFEGQRWPDMSNESWHRDTHRYYNQRPYWSDRSSGTDMGRASDQRPEENR